MRDMKTRFGGRLIRALFSVSTMLVVGLMYADAPANAANCDSQSVLGFTKTQLTVYTQTGKKRLKFSAKETKKLLKIKELPKILDCNFNKGLVQIRAYDGTKYWVKDYHIETAKPLRTFDPIAATPNFSGPKLGSSRGYGSK